MAEVEKRSRRTGRCGLFPSAGVGQIIVDPLPPGPIGILASALFRLWLKRKAEKEAQEPEQSPLPVDEQPPES